MKFLTSKSITKKLVIAIVLVLLVNFTLMPNFSNASLGEDIANIFLEMFLKIGDGIMWILHKVVFGMSESMYSIVRSDANVPWWKVALLALCAVVAIAGWVIGVIATGGALAIVSGVMLVGAVTGGVVTRI